jgi:hypothetical protein
MGDVGPLGHLFSLDQQSQGLVLLLRPGLAGAHAV